MLEFQDKGTDCKSNDSEEDENDQECHNPLVSRMPGSILVGGSGRHEVVKILNDLFLEGCRDLRVTFVSNSLLG